MFNFLLEAVNGGVVGDSISENNSPFTWDKGTSPSFFLGIFIGLLIALILWGIKKLIIMVINDHKEKKAKEETEKNPKSDT